MSGEIARFGQVEFDVARGRLAAGGKTVKLDRPCAAILATLVDEAGREVGKDRLLEVGWPGRVVHENSLAKAIGRLRSALGGDGRVLETVHGYGYRLDAQPVYASPAPRRSDKIRRTALVGGAVAAAASAALALGAFRGTEEPALRRGEPADAVGRVLWVDDNPQNNARERQFLERRNIAVYQVESSDEALALLAMYEYGAVISDMNRDGRPLAGLELVREMRRRGDATPFYLYTVVPSAEQQALVNEAGAQLATVTPDELYAAVLPIFGARATGRTP